MKKYVIFSMALIFAMILPMLVATVAARDPAPVNPPTEGAGNDYMTHIEETIQGGGPATLDPAGGYDSASNQLLFDNYDTMLLWVGEQSGGGVEEAAGIVQYIPSLATNCWVGPPAAGAPAYTNFTVYYLVRTGVNFHQESVGVDYGVTYTLHPYDVEYSFERMMVHDYVGGPQWMIYEPLADRWSANLADPNWGTKIDNAVESNSTHVWFNIANQGLATGTASFSTMVEMFPGGLWNTAFWTQTAVLPINYPVRVFLQEFDAPGWGSIVSRDWVQGWLNPWFAANSVEHPNGDWPGMDYSAANWTFYYNDLREWPFLWDLPVPAGSATLGGVTCGTGPFMLETLADVFWSAVRNTGYWAGYPATTPNTPYYPRVDSGINNKGYVNRVVVKQVANAGRVNDLNTGQCDTANIRRIDAGGMHVGGNRNGVTNPNIRLRYPTYGLTSDSWHMNLHVEVTPGNTYGIIYPTSEFHEDGIPENFFNDMNVRHAMMHIMNYSVVVNDQFLGEGYQPHTCAPDGMRYVNTTQPRWATDFAAAELELEAAHGGALVTNGFTITFNYNAGNAVRQAYSEAMANAINGYMHAQGHLNWHAVAQGNNWGQMLADMALLRLQTFGIGWIADYNDFQNFIFTYLHTSGLFASEEAYSNPVADNLLNQAIRTPDGPIRAALYQQLQDIYYNDAISVTVLFAFGRQYERDWNNGRFTNPLYPGIYHYMFWEWNYYKGDVNKDTFVNMGDITTTLVAFGSYYGQGSMPVIHPRWNYWCDIDDSPRYRWQDRKIDIGDIVQILSNFGAGPHAQWIAA
jgi:peptide/nickel transport system substrate-binding protein